MSVKRTVYNETVGKVLKEMRKRGEGTASKSEEGTLYKLKLMLNPYLAKNINCFKSYPLRACHELLKENIPYFTIEDNMIKEFSPLLICFGYTFS